MRHSVLIAAFAVLVLPLAARAQLAATGPVVNGHHHLNVSNVEDHQRFWIDTLGGRPGTFAGRTPIAIFPEALVFFREQAPTGGSVGSTVDHVAFSVPNLREVVGRIDAAGYAVVTAAHSPPGSEVVDNIRIVPGNGPVSGIAYVLGPDDVKVEVLEMRGQEAPIVSHHIHFFGHENERMRDWYADIFGAQVRPGAAPGFLTATLPGLSMNYTGTESAMAATAGRSIDHIGIEVEDLEGFIADLEAKGITLDVPYREIPDAGLAIAFLTDPWGTYIELTEGLDLIEAPVTAAAIDPLEEMRARAEIEELAARYVNALDTLDAEAYASVFTEDAVFDVAGTIHNGRAAIRKIVTDLQDARARDAANDIQSPALYHVMSNPSIQIIDANEARYTSYAQTVRAAEGGQFVVGFMGRYEDVVVKRDGRWQILSRKLVSFVR